VIETDKKETRRQIIHFSGIASVFFVLYFGKFVTGAGALIISAGLFALSFYVKMKNEIRKKLPFRIKFLENLEDSFHQLLDSVERETSGVKYMGAILFFFGIGFSLLVFPLKIAILSVIVVSVGDSLSTLVGVHWGRHKTKINPKKSWEGTLGGFLGAFVVCLIFTNLWMAIIAAGVGMIMELLPVRINDNLLIPFSVGIVIFGIKTLGLPV